MAHASYYFYKVFGLALYLIWQSHALQAQSNRHFLASEHFNNEFRGSQSMRIAFYNVENLFDYFDDSLKRDDEFLPYQAKFWTKERYTQKVQKVAQVITALGGWEAPALLGLCEIENQFVLNSLVNFSILQPHGYQFLHKDSPDQRGIDVALLYRPNKFNLLNFEFIEVNFPFDSTSSTRDILYAQGKLANQDTLHLMINHWPSKFGGEFETMKKRLYVAQLVKHWIDSLSTQHPNSQFIIMGDLNDTPESESVQNLSTHPDLVNLMAPIAHQYGTHSFEGQWSMIDQFIVSKSLLKKSLNLQIKDQTAHIFNPDFLLTEGANGNKRPFRTYQGPSYKGGFSDHLPIYLDLIMK